MKEFSNGTTIEIIIEIENSSGTKTDPSGDIVITITPEGGEAVITLQDMTKRTTGVYFYLWQTSGSEATGVYESSVAITDDAYAIIASDNLFRIV